MILKFLRERLTIGGVWKKLGRVEAGLGDVVGQICKVGSDARGLGYVG